MNAQKGKRIPPLSPPVSIPTLGDVLGGAFGAKTRETAISLWVNFFDPIR